MKCPNKNSAEWKYLVSNIGEFNAYKVFIQNNDEVPTMAVAKEYVKQLNNNAHTILNSEELKWYESLTTEDGQKLSSIIPISTMFDAFNKGDRSVVAKWTKDGIILYKGADKTDIYHEAFHAFSQVFLERGEREGLYDEVRSKTGSFTNFNNEKVKFENATDIDVEEYLAEEFRKFMMGNKTYRQTEKSLIAKIFNNLKKFLNYLFSNSDLSTVNKDVLTDKKISELFERLRKGNLGNPVFQYNERFVRSGLNRKKTNVINVNKEDTRKLSLQKLEDLNEFINYHVGQYLMEELVNHDKKSEFEQTPLYKFILDDEYRKEVYSYVKDRLLDLRDEQNTIYQAALNKNSKLIIDEYANKLDEINYIIDNFNEDQNYKDARGIIGWYTTNSDFMSDIAAFDNVYADRSGNEINSVDYLNGFLKLLFGTIPKAFTSDELVDVNSFGTPKLFSYKEVYNVLNNMTKAQKGLWTEANSINEIYERLDFYANKLDEKHLVADIILKVLKEPSEQNRAMLPVWRNLSRTIGLPASQITSAEVVINKTEQKYGDETVVVKSTRINTRNSNSLHQKIQNSWVSKQASKRNDPSVIKTLTPEGSFTAVYNHGFINKQLIDLYKLMTNKTKYPEVSYFSNRYGVDISIKVGDEPLIDIFDSSIPENIKNDLIYTWLNIIGVTLPNLSIVKKQIVKNVDGLHYMYKDFYDKSYHGKSGPSGAQTLADLYADNSARFNSLSSIKLSVDKDYSNPSVTTVEEKSQFEQSLPSSAHHIVERLNKSTDYSSVVNGGRNEEVAADDMNHLHPDRNPWVSSSRILRKMFYPPKIEFNETNYYDLINSRRNFNVNLRLNFIDGLRVREESESLFGLKNSNLDPLSKYINDLVFFFRYGVTEAHRHGDKNTTPLISTSDGKPYIGYLKFMNLPGMNSGNREMLEIAKDYFYAETDRIIRAKNDMTIKNATVAGSKKTLQDDAKTYMLFDKILSNEVKNALYKIINRDDVNTLEDFQEAMLESSDEVAVILGNNEKGVSLETDMMNYFNQLVKDNMSFLIDQIKGDRRLTLHNLTNSMLDAALEGDIKVLKDRAATKQTIANSLNLRQRFEGLVRSFVMNDFIHKVETSILIYGDPYNYNHAKDDYTKRIGGASSTGNVPDISVYTVRDINQRNPFQNSDRKYDGTLNSAVLNDPAIESYYKKQWLDHVKNEESIRLTGLNKSKAFIKQALSEIDEKFEEAYSRMKDADAQGYISFDMYRILSISLDEWTSDHESMYQKLIAGEDLSLDVVNKFFPVKKFQYWGPVRGEGLPIMAFHKYSLMPLLPQVLKDSTTGQLNNLGILNQKMQDQEIDYITFGSGSKQATYTSNGSQLDALYSDEESSILALEDKDYKFTKNTLYAKYLKNQLKIHDTWKNAVVFSTQYRKLIISHLWDSGVPISANAEKYTKDFEASIQKLTDFYIEELKKETSLNPTTGVIEDKKKLINYLSTALEAKQIPTQYIDFIQSLTEKMSVNLDYLVNAAEIEKLVTSLLYKKLINHRTNGEALVQVSNFGFEQPGYFTRKTSSRTLKSYRLENGRVQSMEVKIAIQGQFKKLLEQREVLERAEEKSITPLKALNELINEPTWLEKYEDLITMTGVRIPVQGLNSMELMKVQEFFDESVGSLIVVPAEIVGKSGADFDIDKLTVLMPNLSIHGGDIYLSNLVPGSKTLEELQVEKTNILKKLRSQKSELQKIYDLFKRKINLDSKYITPEEKKRLIKIFKAQKKRKNQIDVEMEALKAGTLSTDPESGSITEEELESIYNDKLRESSLIFRREIKSIRKEIVDEFENTKDNTLREQLADINAQIDKLTKKGLENEVFYNTVNILRDPVSFSELVTPNTTKTAKDGLADKIKVETGQVERNDVTRIFENLYHIKKLDYNAVGKSSLGIGAVDNTAFSLFKRVGMYLNPQKRYLYAKKAKYDVVQDLRFKHNKIGKNISLSNKYDANGKYLISDIISQLMNGWVDVAKDEWIFFIQGNKVLAPSLLFLVEAGVDINEAGYFMTQPVIKEFYRRVRSYEGALFHMNSNSSISKNEILYQMLQELLGEKYIDSFFREESLDLSAKRKVIALIESYSHSKASKQKFKLNDLKATINDDYRSQLNYLLEFARIFQMSNDLTELKQVINFDTNPNKTFFDIQENLVKRKNISNGIPSEKVLALLNETPISAFNIQEEGIKFFNDILPIRNQMFNYSSLQSIKQKLHPKNFYALPKNEEKLLEIVRNATVSYLFQNSYYKGTIVNDTYKGYKIESVDKLKNVSALKDGKIYFDKDMLQRLLNPVKATEGSIPIIFSSDIYDYDLVPLPIDFVTTHSNRLKEFVTIYFLEREIQRGLEINKPENVKNSRQYKRLLRTINKQERFKEFTEDDKAILAYQIIIRNRTLNEMNPQTWLFLSDFNYASQFEDLLGLYKKELFENSLVHDHIEVYRPTKRGKNKSYNDKIQGLRLVDNFINNDVKYNISNEIKNLTNEDYVRNALNIAAEEESIKEGSKIVKRFTDQDVFEITSFFKRFSLFAYLQSGHTSNDPTGLLSVIDPKEIYDLLSTTISPKALKLYNENDYNQAIANYLNSNSKSFAKLDDYVLTTSHILSAEAEKMRLENEEMQTSETTTESNLTEGIEINSYQKGLGNDLTNVHYATNGKSKFDILPSDKTLTLTPQAKKKWGESVEAWYQSNNAKTKGIEEGVKGDEYDFNLMVGLITDKLTQYPELAQQITERGGVLFLENSTHTMGDGRWSSKNSKNMFMRSLIQAYQNVSTSPISSSNLTEELAIADMKKPIQQNFKDGSGGRKMQEQFKGKTTMQLVQSGDRTRTTRSKTWVADTLKEWGLTDIKQLEGKVIKQVDKSGNEVYTRITSVNELTQEYQDRTWMKEGWVKSVTDKLVGNYPVAVEFEVVSVEESSTNNVTTVSEDYGVVKVDTQPTPQQTESFVELLRPQIQKQLYKENVGRYANSMFHFELMWARTNTVAEPIKIDSFDGGRRYKYHAKDQNGNILPKLSELQPIIDHIQNNLGIDMSDYDSMIGNLYLDDQYVYPHKDTSESKSARNYPVIVYTIGNDAGLGIVDNNDGKMTFANQYDSTYLPTSDKLKGYTNEVLTKDGTIYTFGLDGKGRFELTHSTPINNKKMVDFPPITLPNGKVVTKYTITLTFRRAQDIVGGVPESPKKLDTASKRSTSPTTSQAESKEVITEYFKKDNNDNNLFSFVDVKGLDSGNLRFLAQDNIIYFYNGAFSLANANQLIGSRNEEMLKKLAKENRLINFAYRTNLKTTQEVDILNDSTYEQNIQMIDEQIEMLKSYEAQGYTLVFEEYGYGHLMLGYDQFGRKIKNLDPIGARTYAYLTKALYDNFKYINSNKVTNKNLDISMEVSEHIKAKQGITDEQIREQILNQLKSC